MSKEHLRSISIADDSVGSEFVEIKNRKISLSEINSLVIQGHAVKLWSDKLERWILVVHSDLVKQSAGDFSIYSILELKMLIDSGITDKASLTRIDQIKRIFSCRIVSVT